MHCPSNGVATSNAAAASVQPEAARLRALVLNAIRSFGTRGATCDEVEYSTGLKHQTASARVNELRNLAIIVDSGNKRPTRSGRKAIVWRVAS